MKLLRTAFISRFRRFSEPLSCYSFSNFYRVIFKWIEIRPQENAAKYFFVSVYFNWSSQTIFNVDILGNVSLNNVVLFLKK